MPKNCYLEKRSSIFHTLIIPEESDVSPHHGLRKGKYKIIHYYPFDEWEFFDLENDPNELQNLYLNEMLFEPNFRI